jgi:predicted HicB family RNase H-like nuclease
LQIVNYNSGCRSDCEPEALFLREETGICGARAVAAGRLRSARATHLARVSLTKLRHACYIPSVPKIKSMNLRDAPEDLMRRAKAAAAMQGITLREFVFKAMEEKLKKAK